MKVEEWRKWEDRSWDDKGESSLQQGIKAPILKYTVCRVLTDGYRWVEMLPIVDDSACSFLTQG